MRETERMVFEKYEAQGYDCIKAGIPDLILLKEGKLEFIEIKSLHSELSEYQKRAFRILRKHGISVRIERVERPRRSHETVNYEPLSWMTDEEKREFDRFLEEGDKEDQRFNRGEIEVNHPLHR